MIDVLVPIYGNLQALERCVDSVLAGTSGPFRFILIDDASPDPAIGEYLRRLASHPACLVFRNRTNHGFVGTVNRALRMSTDDVVMLNSDTIVTRGWLDKMHTCAYSLPRVATVTPLTNEGTICAIPEWNQRNVVPAGYRLADYAELIEHVSARSYPEIPTAVGFCTYITREAIDAVGTFDEVTFGRGYGEENDFCMRAAAAGFRHLLDDATFVYHEGGESFGEKKAALLEENYRALLEKHPHYGQLVQSFIARKPLADIHASIRDAIQGRKRQRVRVLILLHELLDVIGGTEAHTRDLLSSVDAADLLVAVQREEGLIVEEFRGGERTCSERFIPSGNAKIRSRDWYRSLLRRLRVQILHVQHLLNHDPAVVSAAVDLGIPVVFVWHDYHLLCPSYNLINDAGQFCNWCRDLDACDRCLGHQAGFPVGFQKAWRRVSQDLIHKISAHVFPSEACLRGVRSVFTVDAQKVQVIPHGRVLTSQQRTHDSEADSPLRAAFLGVRSLQKGSRVFDAVVDRIGTAAIEWHTFGDSPVTEAAQGPRITHHGPYERNQICELLQQARIDVVLLLSIWPETFCYTLTEAWVAGIPVIGTSLGAIGERLHCTGAGWTVDIRKPQEIASLLARLNRDRAELRDKTERARSVSLPHLSQMARAYGEIYRRLLAERDAVKNNSAPSLRAVHARL